MKGTIYVLKDEYGRVLDEDDNLDRIRKAKKANPGSKYHKKRGFAPRGTLREVKHGDNKP